METNNNVEWLANYYFRTKQLATLELKTLEKKNITPKIRDRKVERYTLPQYIKFLGHAKAAEILNCSVSTIKAWRYGYRLPSIPQAKNIIRATEGRLDFESIYGNLKDIIENTE